MSRDSSELAFPYEEHNGDGTIYKDHFGMLLRDYFAAKAMQGLMADPTCEWSAFEIAKAAYVTADTMLAVRGAK